MGMVDDVLKVLDRIPIWKRLNDVPDEIDDLTRRVAELENKLGGKWPADVCRFCGERSVRMVYSALSKEEWKCQECGKRELRAS